MAQTSDTPAFTVAYTGEPFRVEPSRIGAGETTDDVTLTDPDWSVPTIDQFFDTSTGRLPELIDLAVSTGAIVVPPGLSLIVYSDQDEHGVGFYVMVANAPSPQPPYLTTGWNNVREVAVDLNQLEDWETEQALAPERIGAALHYVVACANQALGVSFTEAEGSR